MSDMADKCLRCGRRIPRTETAMVWKDVVVCENCHAKLESASRQAETGTKKKTIIFGFAMGAGMLAIGIVIGAVAFRGSASKTPIVVDQTLPPERGAGASPVIPATPRVADQQPPMQ